MNPAWIVAAVVAVLVVASRRVTLGSAVPSDDENPAPFDPATADLTTYGPQQDEVTPVTIDPNYPPGLIDLATAIAGAEGYGIVGAIPTRANNPGDLVVPGWRGEKLGAEGISVFDTAEQGWAALYRQLSLILDGRSHVYESSMTIGEMADHWTRTQKPDWARNVAAYLREHGYPDATVNTTLDDLFYA